MSELSFEKAYERLEQILETMNGGSVPLEEALKLYEEADILLRSCHGRLSSAEQKIETLIKQRNGELALDEQGQPQRTAFQPGMAR
ncbi:MAG: exodeoxyribonuclease VII small subunit [Simkania sp.]|nr:exodeoxyribonuclease VII small subunit [Simkania sp.]